MKNMDRTEAIQNFLKDQACKLDLYRPELEVQVNVLPGPNRETLSKGILWSDDKHSWKAYRIPYQADSLPVYNGRNQDWPLENYAEAIGLTGWNWANQTSEWVGFDFDSVVGHAKGLTDNELEEIKNRVKEVPWITIRRSKSGRGLHLYVSFASPVGTNNHKEHAALAKSILAQLSGLLKFDFSSKVDVAGHVLWIWHRDGNIAKRSFELIKQGIPLRDVPVNWQDYLITKRTAPALVGNKELQDLISKTKKVELDDDHRKLLTWFANQQTTWWWDAELEMLVCHTKDLARAHDELHLRGIFETISTGRDLPNDQNCFAFPMRNGSWCVRRHGLRTKESKSWILDSAGWTKCFYNRIPDLETVSRIHNGIKTSKSEFVFNKFADAYEALEELEVEDLNWPDLKHLANRQATLRSKDSEVIISIKRHEDDPDLEGWAAVKGPKWERVVSCVVELSNTEPPDNIVRYTVKGSKQYGWFTLCRGTWNETGKDNIKPTLVSLGIPKPDLDSVVGQSVLNPWELVNYPFQGEYPGDRKWNKESSQLAFKPKPGPFTTWQTILNHIGQSLDSAVEQNEWCRKYNILNGQHYLALWVSSLFKYPMEPLPYLFLYGDQNTGKSILHEALSLLFKDQHGYCKADVCLTTSGDFNGELANAILCVVEEVNVSKSSKANERIKDWVTGRTLAIRDMRKSTFTQPNTTHWIQCANDSGYCPVFPGDSRIVVAYVSKPKVDIPKQKLLEQLTEEAPAFLSYILSLDVPESDSRLRIPVITTTLKESLSESNETGLERFLAMACTYEPGRAILLKEFTAELVNFLDDRERLEWTPRRVAKELNPIKYPKGRMGTDGQMHIGNISIKGIEGIAKSRMLIRDSRGFLIES